jgi:drug/metabolite transporter (DMT)-like permease
MALAASAAAGQSTGDRSIGRGADLGAFVTLALMVLIGSSTATAAKFAVRELPVGLLPVVRFGCAGLCLVPLLWRSGSLRRMIREDGVWLLAASALCVPINQNFFLNATKLTATSHVALIYAACPLVVLALAVAMRQERLTFDRLLGILATVAGVAVIGLGSFWNDSVTARDELRGDLLTVGAVASWGAYMTVSKRLITRHGALPALAATFLLGAVLDLPIAWLSVPSGFHLNLASASPSAWRAVVYLVLVSTLMVQSLQNQALLRLDASQVATFNNISPYLTVIWGVWLFDEPVQPALVFGAVLTLAGIILSNRPERLAAAHPAGVILVEEESPA